MTFGGDAKFLAILILLLAIRTYVGLLMRTTDNIVLPIPDDEIVQKKLNTTVFINPNPNPTVISNNYNNSETIATTTSSLRLLIRMCICSPHSRSDLRNISIRLTKVNIVQTINPN